MPFHTDGISSQLPKAFANLYALSTMGMGATMGMVFGNKSFEQVTKDEAAKLSGAGPPPSDLLLGEDSDLPLSPEELTDDSSLWSRAEDYISNLLPTQVGWGTLAPVPGLVPTLIPQMVEGAFEQIPELKRRVQDIYSWPYPTPYVKEDERRRAADVALEFDQMLEPTVGDPRQVDWWATSGEIVKATFSWLVSGDATESDVVRFIEDPGNAAFMQEHPNLMDALYSAIAVVNYRNKAMEQVPEENWEHWPSFATDEDAWVHLTPDAITKMGIYLGDELTDLPVHPLEFSFHDDSKERKALTVAQQRAMLSSVSQRIQEGVADMTVDQVIKDVLAEEAAPPLNYAKIFSEAAEKSDYAQSSSMRIREESGELAGEAKALFFLHHSDLIGQDVASGDYKSIGEWFDLFLSRDEPVPIDYQTLDEDPALPPPTRRAGYVEDPYLRAALKRGPEFSERIKVVKAVLNIAHAGGYGGSGYPDATQEEKFILQSFLPGSWESDSTNNLMALAKINYTGGRYSYELERLWNENLRGVYYRSVRGSSPMDEFNLLTSSIPVEGVPPVQGGPRGIKSVDIWAPGTVSAPPEYDFSGMHALRERAFPGSDGFQPGQEPEEVSALGAPVSNIISPSSTPMPLASTLSDQADNVPVTSAGIYDDPVAAASLRALHGLPQEAAEGIPGNILSSMPDPFDDKQWELRGKGLPYLTGQWTGGSLFEWEGKSEEEKKKEKDLGEWTTGTMFVPTKAFALLLNEDVL
jgi:hypothetical protein